MNGFLFGAGFWRFPTDNLGHWLLAAALLYSIALLCAIGLRDEMLIAEKKALPKTGAARAISYAIGVILFIVGIAHGTLSVSIFYILLPIPTLIIMLTLASNIRKKEMKFVESDELIDTRDNDKNDPSQLIQ